MDLLKILFITLLLVFYPLGEITRISFGEAAVTLIDITVGLIVFAWLFLKISRGVKIEGKLFKPIIIFVLVLILSLVVNAEKLNLFQLGISASYILRWILYALIYFVVKDFDLNFKKGLPYLMLGSGALITLGGFVQYFLYPDLRNLYYLGWDEHLYRMFGSFLDPNFAGSFFVLYLLFVFGLFKDFKIRKYILIPIFTFSLVSILLTFSRAAYVMFLVGVGGLLIVKEQIKNLLFIIGIFTLSVFLISELAFKSEGTNLLRTASGEARIDSVNNAIKIFKDNQILGVGFNSYRYAQKKYGFINEDKKLIHSAAGTDNSFLFVLASSGVFGLLSFIFLLYKIIDLSKLKIKNSIAIVFFASVVSLSVNSFFINSLFFPQLMLWIWILAGLTEST